VVVNNKEARNGSDNKSHDNTNEANQNEAAHGSVLEMDKPGAASAARWR
jgi:hypothetical protein